MLPTFIIIIIVFAALISAYVLLIFLLSIPRLQRFALYAHKIRTPTVWHNVYQPHDFGFAKNQITPFRIKTSDGVVLFAWHVLPLGLYEQHESKIREQPPGLAEDITKTTGFQLLSTNPESRVIINFHGNAGHVAQGWRTDTYRVLTCSEVETHVLTIDYRGFSLSTGSPDEHGLILDGVTLVNWVMKEAKIPPERIVLLGQSLGTAVASGVAHHFATNPQGPISLTLDPPDESSEVPKERVVFAGVVLVAAFAYLPNLLLTYKIGGFLPILAPLRPFRFMHRLVDWVVVDKWNTAERLARYQRAVKGTKSQLTLIHATNDGDIPWKNSRNLFISSVRGSIGDDGQHYDASGLDVKQGGLIREWSDGEGRNIRLEIVEHGGHNRIVTYSYVSLGIIRSFRRAEAKSTSPLI